MFDAFSEILLLRQASLTRLPTLYQPENTAKSKHSSLFWPTQNDQEKNVSWYGHLGPVS
jgi:hypothetical protein